MSSLSGASESGSSFDPVYYPDRTIFVNPDELIGHMATVSRDTNGKARFHIESKTTTAAAGASQLHHHLTRLDIPTSNGLNLKEKRIEWITKPKGLFTRDEKGSISFLIDADSEDAFNAIHAGSTYQSKSKLLPEGPFLRPQLTPPPSSLSILSGQSAAGSSSRSIEDTTADDLILIREKSLQEVEERLIQTQATLSVDQTNIEQQLKELQDTRDCIDQNVAEKIAELSASGLKISTLEKEIQRLLTEEGSFPDEIESLKALICKSDAAIESHLNKIELLSTLQTLYENLDKLNEKRKDLEFCLRCNPEGAVFSSRSFKSREDLLNAFETNTAHIKHATTSIETIKKRFPEGSIFDLSYLDNPVKTNELLFEAKSIYTPLAANRIKLQRDLAYRETTLPTLRGKIVSLSYERDAEQQKHDVLVDHKAALEIAQGTQRRKIQDCERTLSLKKGEVKENDKALELTRGELRDINKTAVTIRSQRALTAADLTPPQSRFDRTSEADQTRSLRAESRSSPSSSPIPVASPRKKGFFSWLGSCFSWLCCCFGRSPQTAE